MKVQKPHQIKKENSKLHPSNKHQGRYDFDVLTLANSSLQKHVILNPVGDSTIDFSDDQAVKELNRALLMAYYQIEFWDIPKGYLCPPIPGRADYIHNAADLIYGDEKRSAAQELNCLDVGVGANCIYPIIGVSAYGWNFIGSDITKESIDSAIKIVNANQGLKNKVSLRHQTDKSRFFSGVITERDRIDLSICNPPFHASAKEAQKGSLRKAKNLKYRLERVAKLNFAGQQNELWCEGGELSFLKKMIAESKQFKNNVRWFTSLVSKEANLKPLLRELKSIKATRITTKDMAQGNKKSRMLAWSFLSKQEDFNWLKTK